MAAMRVSSAWQSAHLVLGAFWGALALLGFEAEHDGRKLSSGFAAVSGGIAALAAINPWASTLPLFLMLAGFFMAVSNTSANSRLQATAPRGFAVELSAFTCSRCAAGFRSAGCCGACPLTSSASAMPSLSWGVGAGCPRGHRSTMDSRNTAGTGETGTGNAMTSI